MPKMKKAEREQLRNKQFGYLKAIRECEERNPRGLLLWEFECKCGNVVKKPLARVMSGEVSSCGCLRADTIIGIRKKYNRYDLTGEYGIGYTSNDEPFYFDLEDYNKIKEYNWVFDSKKNVLTNINKVQVSMKKMVLGVDSNNKEKIYCLNGINYDIRKENLRIGSASQTMLNASHGGKVKKNNVSGHTGVYFNKARGKWCAQINIDRKNYYLGKFDNIEDAVKARKQAEEKILECGHL